VSEQPDDPPAKSPLDTVVEHAVETFVYAPIGLLFDGASLLPQLVEKGRTQVTMARMLGKFAVEQGRDEATKAASKLQDQAAGVLELLAGAAAPMPADDGAIAPVRRPRPASRPGAKAPGAARDAARRTAGVVPTASSAPTTASASAKRATPAGKVAPARANAGRSPAPRSNGAKASSARVPDAASLAIPDYDGLSASHVVNRLAGLAPGELEAVREYESAHRGRKTILSKVAQLQSS
jgi:hypothetical protein